VFSRSTDGGRTFSTSMQLTAAAGNAQQIGRQGCVIRTDGPIVMEPCTCSSRAPPASNPLRR
jgi:hypothetical protein